MPPLAAVPPSPVHGSFPVLQILAITAPLFLLIGLGFAAHWGNLVNREQIRGIGSFVIHFALPALLFKALAERPLQQTLDLRYLLAYSLGSLAVFALGFAGVRLLRRESLSATAWKVAARRRWC